VFGLDFGSLYLGAAFPAVFSLALAEDHREGGNCVPFRGVRDDLVEHAPGLVLPARDQLEGGARAQVHHRPADDAAVRLDQAAKVGDVVPGEDPQVLVRQALDRA
jgi:hypothetical protein